ncbi:metal ABC transporter permease [Escherichia coli O150]|nr:metal ABC transporter permease [Escherichia coli O150]
MNYALIIAIIISFPCALLSVFLVLKDWALIGDAMNHAMFPGIVLAWIIGMPLGIGAFIVGLSCAIATGYLKDNSIIKKDTIIGIVFSGIFVLTINRHKSADYRYHYYITVYSAWYRLPFLPHEKQSELFCLYTINSSRVYCCPHHASLS